MIWIGIWKFSTWS